MVKATRRDTRALERNLFKIKQELAQTERNATTRTKTMSALKGFLHIGTRKPIFTKKCTEFQHDMQRPKKNHSCS